jgi:hypothetical protein
MKRLLGALAAWRGRGLSPQGATAIRRAARDSAFSLLELMELQHAIEAAEQSVDKAVLVSSGRAIQSWSSIRPPDACPEVETAAAAFP